MLKLDQVTRHFPMGETVVKALDGLSLTIKSGELLAIMGPSGSGKSTLMNVLGLLDRPNSGSYSLRGRVVSDLDDDELSRLRNKEIGFIFQTFNLLPRLTALSNVELPMLYAQLGPAERRRRAESLLEQVGLQERMDHRPNQLSGGQRQRVAIARALVNDPALILADEPTGNLDSTTAREILSLLVDLNRQGNTIVLVTHDAEVAKVAHRTILLRDGRITAEEVQRD